MKKHLFLLLLLLSTYSVTAQSDAFWMSFGLGGVQAKKGLLRADFTVSYLRYNRWGGYLDLQSNARSVEGIETSALRSFNGFGGGVAYNFNAFGDQEQKLVARAGFNYGSGTYIDSVKYQYSSQPGDDPILVDWFDHEFSSIGVELSIEGLIVLNRPNQAWGFRLITVLNRHPFIGGCIRFSIGAF